jgi:2-polyprenyl-3-methyl-5-hydroxy-6-metoxy-1,4-benzoquinol methylase
MSSNVVDDYGWNGEIPTSCGYLAPEIVRLLKQLGARKVLDLGCGNGALCGLLHQMHYDVAGVEYDSAGVQLASEKYQDVDFFNLGVQDDPVEVVMKRGLHDIVISTEVIEHLFSPHLLPQFAAKVLEPGGKLIITTPYHGYLKNLVLSISNHWDVHHTALWHGGHIKFWSRETLSKLLRDNGFEVVGFSGVGRVPYLWKSMVLVARLISKK